MMRIMRRRPTPPSVPGGDGQEVSTTVLGLRRDLGVT